MLARVRVRTYNMCSDFRLPLRYKRKTHSWEKITLDNTPEKRFLRLQRNELLIIQEYEITTLCAM